MRIRIGTRGSRLALWQAGHIAELLAPVQTDIVVIKTQGDHLPQQLFHKMEGKGFFTREIEQALLDERIDLAVHSLKDLPTQNPPGLEIAAIPRRADPADMLLIRPQAHDPKRPRMMRPKAVVGTSSLRRQAQLLHSDPDLQIKPLRGNITTRVEKLCCQDYDAIVLARAGIERLGLDTGGLHRHELPVDTFVPAPGQGALALQIRVRDDGLRRIVRGLHHEASALAVEAERSFLEHFGGGCHIPLGAHATGAGICLELTGMIASRDGTHLLRDTVRSGNPVHLGRELADRLKSRGAEKLL